MMCNGANWVPAASGGGLQVSVSTVATQGTNCSTPGQMAKDSSGTLMVCDNSPSTLAGADCSAAGAGAITLDSQGNMYVCAK
jgi:hypothetical protein